MKKELFLIGMLIFTILVSACSEKIVKPSSTISVCVGGQCKTNLWGASIFDVDLKIIEDIYQTHYTLKDDDKTICNKISDNQSICEPKYLQYYFQSHMVEITYKNHTYGCALINDSHTTKNLNSIVNKTETNPLCFYEVRMGCSEEKYKSQAKQDSWICHRIELKEIICELKCLE